MPPILNAQSVSKRYGAKVLFQDVSLVVADGDRIGLVGPNGAGKSTLLSILSGTEDSDTGEVSVRKRARVVTILQTSEFPKGATVREVLERALDIANVPENEREQRIRETVGRTGFPDEHAIATSLSGGWRKRLAIVEGVISQPDVLLLDEPTNHLDLGGIEWLEELLAGIGCACVVVSHDRYFLEAAANEIVELNRVYPGGVLRVKGTYSKFLEDRELFLEAQSRQQQSLKNEVKTEIEWLRRGPKARTTKSKARIDRAHEMIGELADVNQRTAKSSAGLEFNATERQTKRLVELEGAGLDLGGRTLLDKLDYVISAGTRVGLVGPNGSGKTTLLRLLTGELKPTRGTVKTANMLRIVYFSQAREIDTSLTLRRALAPEGDAVVHNGREVHVASWAARFLFTGEQLNQPVERLSGGERARVLIARLMLQPADLLLLDEPTNDLDIPTLEILEESLLEYPGALILVTHDRYMLNRVSTTVLGLDGKGRAEKFADFAQWEDWMRESEAPVPTAKSKAAAASAAAGAAGDGTAKKKLSYNEQREWNTLEARIAEAEARVAKADEALADPKIASDATALQRAMTEQQDAQAAVLDMYVRWEELAERAG
ncbi:ATPase component of ABC transporters with duplicated ATPase domain [Terriglobus roseus DSM 18391]|uniref:ATPase component of ABC transporters with duplicated ATPase domain n=1 Tax=Terriglobus roseus (strain DSM 18391 / NRRL B-41598 / KBS 63) TaxID=926566 RepID=I3ZK74_TERRK|nr:ABC-F family ATP-binding cassette domain-containing protein [Terriglobus roseus]AFL89642.1 ATPase component of ABC transporters with duplicated ATPase domain [Terriglobus roseus DSM 18391]